MNALVALHRSFSRHPRFALINLAGLSLGIAAFLVLSLFVRFETGFDRHLPGWERIWVVDRSLQFGDATPVTIPSRLDMLRLLRSEHEGIAGARLLPAQVAVQNRRLAVKERVGLVDPEYFDLFPLPALGCDPKSALAAPDAAVVTQSAARRHLRPGDPVGQVLTLTIGSETRAARVTCVIADQPLAMTHRPQMFLRLGDKQETWFEGSSGLVTFLSLADNRAAGEIRTALATFNDRHPDPSFQGPKEFIKVTETIVPLAERHLSDPRDRLVVTTLGILGLVSLGLAIINYVNLATGRSDLRAREVALRKVAGAPRRALIAQFLGESLAGAVLAGIGGLALAELALPFVNAAGGLSLDIAYTGREGILPALALAVLVTGLAAGIYPAFVLSRFQPAAVLSSTQSPGTGRGGAGLRTGLVVLQFAAATALLICTFVLFAQARHLQTADLGFDRDGLIVVTSYGDPNLDTAQREALRRAIAAVPGVTGVATSGVIPTGGSYAIRKSDRDGLPVEIDLLEGTLGPDFLEVYEARLLAGRFFDPARFAADLTDRDSESDVGVGETPPSNIIINRSAAEALGFGSPQAAVGRTIAGDGPLGEMTIIGVIENLAFDNPRIPVAPFAYHLSEQGGFAPRLSVRHSGDPQAALSRIEAAWQQHAAAVPFEGQSANLMLFKAFLQSDLQRSRLFALGAGLAVLVGALGLYGLAAFNTARRVREIGIRKSLGASSAAIARLLVGQFLRPVLLANLLAWPLAWLAMREWLSGFAERIALGPQYFLAASLLSLLIAVLTVLTQSLRASRTTPAAALRHV